MEIDKRNDEVVYIKLNGWTYYIDDSTREKIVQRWPEKDSGTDGNNLLKAKWVGDTDEL
jgi:hypothetical protein